LWRRSVRLMPARVACWPLYSAAALRAFFGPGRAAVEIFRKSSPYLLRLFPGNATGRPITACHIFSHYWSSAEGQSVHVPVS
jgi:hypothetical protein